MAGILVLGIPACLFLALVDCFDDFEDSSLPFLPNQLTVFSIFEISACLSHLFR